MKKDVLIIGQGLAGTCLAFTLLKQGLSVHIIDDDHATASSLVGIAVINPVTGRRYAKSWNVDILIPIVDRFYTGICKTLGKEYFSRVELLQILPDNRIEELWMLRCGDPEFKPYLDTDISTLSHHGIHASRFARVRNAFHLEVSHFIKDARRWFLDRFAKIGIPWPGLTGPFVGGVEIVCGALLLVGLATRLAAVPLIINMTVAIVSTKIPILLGHGFWGFSLRELPSYGFWSMAHESRTDFAMMLGSIFLLWVGAGPWALDRQLAQKRTA